MGLEGVFHGGAGASVRLKVTKLTGESFEIDTEHTMSLDQLNWLRLGSALNYIRAKAA